MVAQKGLRIIKIKKIKALVLKVDLSEAYEYYKLALFEILNDSLKMCGPFVSWDMNR